MSADSGFGHNVFKDSGTIVPVNTATIVPFPDEQTTALTNATFMQFLSTKFGLMVGKVYMLDGFQGEFRGNYRTQFMNLGLVFPTAMDLVPISAFGGGIIAIPWENVLLSALLLDPSGTPTNNDISEAFQDGFTVVAGGKVTIKPFGLVGHQQVGGMWSDKTRLALSQDPSNISRMLLESKFPLLGDPGPLLHRFLERFFPQLLTPVQPPRTENSTWAVFYGFDQYLWQRTSRPPSSAAFASMFASRPGDRFRARGVLAVAACLALTGGACASRDAAPAASGSLSLAALAGTPWTLVSLGGQPLPPGARPPTAALDGARVFGFGGCNRYTGPVEERSSGAITIGSLAVTKMACPSPAMEVEDRYLAVLGRATQYVLAGGRLVLSGSASELVFERPAP